MYSLFTKFVDFILSAVTSDSSYDMHNISSCIINVNKYQRFRYESCVKENRIEFLYLLDTRSHKNKYKYISN